MRAFHPGWPNRDGPTAGWIFRIDFIGGGFDQPGSLRLKGAL